MLNGHQITSRLVVVSVALCAVTMASILVPVGPFDVTFYDTSPDDDTFPGGYDLSIRFDSSVSGFSWNFGADNPAGGEADFRSVVAHEIGHGLGFASTYEVGGVADTWWSGGITAWDSYLEDSAGVSPAVGGVGDTGNFNELDDPVFFTGPAAVAAYGGNVPVYAPPTYAGGSSLSHLDETTFGSSLMTPIYTIGTVVREPSDVEWGAMEDIGWNFATAAIPEPSSVLILGLASLAALRRRR